MSPKPKNQSANPGPPYPEKDQGNAQEVISEKSQSNDLDRKNETIKLLENFLKKYPEAVKYTDFIQQVLKEYTSKTSRTPREPYMRFVLDRLCEKYHLWEKRVGKKKTVLMERDPIDAAKKEMLKYSGPDEYKNFISRQFKSIKRFHEKNPEEFSSVEQCVDFVKQRLLEIKKVKAVRYAGQGVWLKKLSKAEYNVIKNRKKAIRKKNGANLYQKNTRRNLSSLFQCISGAFVVSLNVRKEANTNTNNRNNVNNKKNDATRRSRRVSL